MKSKRGRLSDPIVSRVVWRYAAIETKLQRGRVETAGYFGQPAQPSVGTGIPTTICRILVQIVKTGVAPYPYGDGEHQS
jgi:hypothetical protein